MLNTYKLPVSLKLNCKADIDFVFQQPTFKISNAFFLILARKNQLPVPRLGLIVARKNLKKAVDRNKIKRISREFFRLNQHLLQGFDWVLLARPQLKALVNKNTSIEQDCVAKTRLKQELRSNWNRALLKLPKPS